VSGQFCREMNYAAAERCGIRGGFSSLYKKSRSCLWSGFNRSAENLFIRFRVFSTV